MEYALSIAEEVRTARTIDEVVEKAEAISPERIILEGFENRLDLAKAVKKMPRDMADEIRSYMRTLEKYWHASFRGDKNIRRRLERYFIEDVENIIEEINDKYERHADYRLIFPWVAGIALVYITESILIPLAIAYVLAKMKISAEKERGKRLALKAAEAKFRIREAFKQTDLSDILKRNKDYFQRGIEEYDRLQKH